ncbi:ribosome-binding protein 1-like isoform X4 [Battus philenor]|uniref:ribosome-binding protein 1-like isoform X4 n=1 Tax=Battus philenor TaxID=42288 RepID=UPI0035D0411A
MELQALLVLCGLGVTGAAVILLMGLFSAFGTTYEEAIAQQRKATTELLALADNKGKAKKTSKKANKKLAKKEKKENATAATGSEPESEALAESGIDEDTPPAPKPHVEFCPPVVVDVPTDTPPNIKIRKRGKDPKVKPILLNKEDPSCVSDPSSLLTPTGSTVSNHFEEMQPKDEFELLHSTFLEKALEKKEDVEKKDKLSKSAKNAKTSSKLTASSEPVKEDIVQERQIPVETTKEQRKVKKTEKKNTAEENVTVTDEVVPPLNAPQPSELTTEKLLKQALAPVATPPAPSPPGGKNKKKKVEPNVLSLMAGDSGVVAVSELVRVVREATLSHTEIQILTDALLNKHHDPLPEHSEWTEGPNDPMQKLKKQLAEKEKSLADEIEASQALHAKLKELRATLNAERGRAAAASRSAEQAAGAARAELHTLQARLQRVLDDNHALAQEKLLLQSKLGAEGEAQAQRVQMEMHIQRLSESEAALLQQLTALQAEMNTLARETAQARCDAGAARDSMMLAQRHAEDLAQQLQEANRAYAELEQQRQRVVHAEKLAQQELRETQERLTSMSEIQNEVQRLTSYAQAAESNMENLKEEVEKAKQIAEKAKEEAEIAEKEMEKSTEELKRLQEKTEKLKQESNKIREESEQQKLQLSNKIASLEELVQLRESELAEVKQMAAAVPAQNGLPLHNEDGSRESRLQRFESIVETLREELTVTQKANVELRHQVDSLKEQLYLYREKNNEAAAQAQELQYNEVANILRSACPNIALGSGQGRDWLQDFANNLKNAFHNMEAQKKDLEKRQEELQKKLIEEAPTVNSRLPELLVQNEQLQTLVDKYKRVIEDTEGALSRLQQNVTVEEQRWSKQLADKQRELDELRQRTVSQEPLAFAYSCIERSLPTIVEEKVKLLSQMQKKIELLEFELKKAQTANHSHSFADAERLTEERLMGSLTEKLDLSNGPPQVAIQEK